MEKHVNYVAVTPIQFVQLTKNPSNVLSMARQSKFVLLNHQRPVWSTSLFMFLETAFGLKSSDTNSSRVTVNQSFTFGVIVCVASVIVANLFVGDVIGPENWKLEFCKVWYNTSSLSLRWQDHRHAVIIFLTEVHCNLQLIVPSTLKIKQIFWCDIVQLMSVVTIFPCSSVFASKLSYLPKLQEKEKEVNLSTNCDYMRVLHREISVVKISPIFFCKIQPCPFSRQIIIFSLYFLPQILTFHKLQYLGKLSSTYFMTPPKGVWVDSWFDSTNWLTFMFSYCYANQPVTLNQEQGYALSYSITKRMGLRFFVSFDAVVTLTVCKLRAKNGTMRFAQVQGRIWIQVTSHAIFTYLNTVSMSLLIPFDSKCFLQCHGCDFVTTAINILWRRHFTVPWPI